MIIDFLVFLKHHTVAQITPARITTPIALTYTVYHLVKMEVAVALRFAAVAGPVHAHVVVGGDVGSEVVVRCLREA